MIHQTYFDKIKKGARDLKFSMAVVKIVSTFSKKKIISNLYLEVPSYKLDKKMKKNVYKIFTFHKGWFFQKESQNNLFISIYAKISKIKPVIICISYPDYTDVFLYLLYITLDYIIITLVSSFWLTNFVNLYCI